MIDSRVSIAAERRRQTVPQLIESIVSVAGDQDAALSAIGLTELLHGIYRASNATVRIVRAKYVEELLANFTVYPYTTETAKLAGRIDGEQRKLGITIPFSDLLIGVTALSIGFSVLTVNLRHFRLIPGLDVISLV